MRKREVSRKRAAETEKVDELNMEDKEATPVEEIEIITRKDPEKQPEEPTQTEGEKTQEMFKRMMELMQDINKKTGIINSDQQKCSYTYDFSNS